MRPFFKYSDYRFRMKYDYYKSLLRQSPNDVYTAYIRSQFRTFQHTKKAGRVRQLIAKFDRQLQLPPSALTKVGDRWLHVCQLRQEEYEKQYVRYLYNIQAHVKTRVTGSFIYPSYHNRPLPRLKPQPLEIHKMIRRRVLKRFDTLGKLKTVSGYIHDYVMEAEFYKSLGMTLNGAYIVSLFEWKEYLIRKLDDEYRRSQMKFSIKDLMRFRRLHEKRADMRLRSMEWRKANHPHLIAHWRGYLSEKKKERQRVAAKLRLNDSEADRVKKEVQPPLPPPPKHTKQRMRKHTQNTLAKAPYQNIFSKPLKEVYNLQDYNDEPAVKIAYDYTKPPQSLLSSPSQPQNISKWSR